MKRYSQEEAAEILDVSLLTIRKYDEDGLLKPIKFPTGRKYYTIEMLQDFLRGTYNPEEQDKYTCLQEEPIEINLNLNKMVKIEAISEENISYYKIINAKNMLTEFDVVEVERRKTKAEIKYTIGKIVNEEGTQYFKPAISWVSAGF